MIKYTRIHGIKPKQLNQVNDVKFNHAKPIKIFNNVCPDIIFENNRIAKLNTREK